MGHLQTALAGVLSDEEIEMLPRGFERVGHVAILSLPLGLQKKSQTIASELLKIKGVETVALRTGPIEGRKREPGLQVIAGKPSTETTHKENGCLFRLDVSKTMFSTGNVHERQRLPKLVEPGETVVDLFSGVGQFSIPIAKHAEPAEVYATEVNPVAHRYLCENVRINRVGHIVVPILGDCEKVAPRGVADRVVMGLIHVTHLYLPLALQVLKPEGGIIHYHETVPCMLGFERPVSRIIHVAGERDVEILEKRVIKRYCPGVDHVVIDARVR
jgi:tRNA wybutosine-synthesizing protein 2